MAEGSVFEHLYQEQLYVLPARVMVILSQEWETIPEDQQLLLTKILGSVKLSLASVQLLVKQNFSLEELSAYSPEKIIAFGATWKTAHKPYEYIQHDGIKIIISDSLDRLDDAKKKSLWLALKQMFSV